MLLCHSLSSSGDEEEKVCGVGEGQEQLGEGDQDKEEQQQQLDQQLEASKSGQGAAGQETEEECQENPSQQEETTIPKGADDNSMLALIDNMAPTKSSEISIGIRNYVIGLLI